MDHDKDEPERDHAPETTALATHKTQGVSK